ncbi:STAS domain-containing protein [Spongisporangium articulatum]|uniref:STAS domain-containing protein n=1 Tax=Spongisporangium articulatum TaxID=3362603 RepID=A0ABW8AM71_9ACTN
MTSSTTAAAPLTLPAPHELTVAHAAAVKDSWFGALYAAEPVTGRTVELDLSEVTELDTAGLQLLLIVYREVAARGESLTLAGLTEPVRQVLHRVGLREDLTIGGGDR